jgi:hypothetical protein
LSGNTAAAKKFLSQTGTGAVSAAPVWSTVTSGDISGAALTKTDDTNVTLTLAGSPSTALLNASSITAGWTGTLSVSRGGWGVGTLTAHAVYVGNGTSAPTALSVGASNTFLKGSTGADPAFGTATLASADFANQGTTTTVLHGNAAGNPSFSQVSLANDVTGNLGVSHLNSGTSASATTFWRGDGAWATPAASAASIKIGTFTRGNDTASGTQAITGVGFAPSKVLFYAVLSGGSQVSWGMDDGTNAYATWQFSTAGQFRQDASNSIVLLESSGNDQRAHITTLGADGFTLTWTKSGSPSAGTDTMFYMAFQ